MTQLRTAKFWLLLCLIGCRAEESSTTSSTDIHAGRYVPVQRELVPDPVVASVIQPYRDKIRAVMDEQVGVATADVFRGRPESALGNLVADALLSHARFEFGDDVDLAVINNGGIRLPSIAKGPITVGDVYQLVPFDNRVVVLTMKGSEVAELIRQLASGGFEPMAGCSYKVSRDQMHVSDIRVRGQKLDAEQIYQLATVDYLASIGGEFQGLQLASERRDGRTYLRDAVIRYIRGESKIEPLLDGRVSYADES